MNSNLQDYFLENDVNINEIANATGKTNISDDTIILFGCATPAGDTQNKDIGYPTDQEVSEFRNYAVGLPVFINHLRKTDNDTPVEPCGQVIWGNRNEKNKKFFTGIALYNNANGKLAQKLVNDPKNPLRELSAGYDIIAEEVPDPVIGKFPEVKGKKFTEVSLCYKGVRDGTEIFHVFTYKDFKNLLKGGTNMKIPQTISTVASVQKIFPPKKRLCIRNTISEGDILIGEFNEFVYRANKKKISMENINNNFFQIQNKTKLT